MRTILIVDDEINIRKVIEEYAILHGYQTLMAATGYEAIDMVASHDIDLIVLDIMMPELDGYSALKQIKTISDIPVIILSARFEEYDKLLGFELGVDDYVVKPFSPRELMARINTVINRKGVRKNVRFVYKGLVVDYDAKTVEADGTRLNLTPKEYDLLVFLIEHKNQALSRDMLLNKVWDYDYFGDDRTIDTHIKMLRKNLGAYRTLIVTVRGTGYKFELEN